MTENQQRRFYFPLWNQVARANDWIMVRGRLLGLRADRHGLAESSRLYNAVRDAAELLARNEHRAVTATDLRHACHVVALSPSPRGEGRGEGQNLGKTQSPSPRGEGRGEGPLPISSKNLTNKQLDRVAALFRLLINPDDIDASINWSDPSKAESKRLEFVIRRAAPFAYIDKLCRDKFGPLYSSPFWEDLPLHALKQLAMTLRNRTAAQQQPIAQHVVPASAGPIDISKNFAQSAGDPF